MIGAVLAGGRARRMGGVKPAAELRGRPLVAYPLAAVRKAGLQPLVVARTDTPLPELDVPVVFDADAVVHPFTGVVTALDHASEAIVVVAADMPLVRPSLLRRLASMEQPVVVCRAGGRLQPLCARYSPAVRDHLARAATGGASMRATVEALGAAVIEVDAREVANVNTPEDLALLEGQTPE